VGDVHPVFVSEIRSEQRSAPKKRRLARLERKEAMMTAWSETLRTRVMGNATGITIVIQAIASLALRFALATPFWRSGLTRWEGFLSLRPDTLYFFQRYYQPNIFGKVYALPFPELLAWVASAAEIVLPAALVLGLATRISALGLLCMTAVIFTIYPQNWPTEMLPWAAMALGLIAYGPGRVSLDYLIWRHWNGR
jgi:putative oxidoreductase